MTSEQADIVMKEYGKFLEHVDYKITPVFSVGKPESILPFPKKVIAESLNMMRDQFSAVGDTKMVNAIEQATANLVSYIADEEALAEAVKRISDSDYVSRFTIRLWKNIQDENLKKLV